MDAFDLEGYVRDHAGVRVKRGEYMLRCPRCGKRKIQVSIPKRVWHCWVCYEREQLAGGLPALVALLEDLPLDQAVQKIMAESQLPFEQLPELPLDPPVGPPARLKPIGPPDGAKWLDGTVPYSQYRGISADEARARRLMYVPAASSSHYRNRLVFPVWSGGGWMLYWQARWMGDPPPDVRKALNPTGVHAARTLYGWEYAQQYASVVLVEGPMDAIRVGRDAAGTWGKRLHAAQIALLLAAGVRSVELMWDADAWADMVAAAQRLVHLGLSVRVCRLPWGDPADHDPQTLWQVRQQAVAVPAPGLEVV